MSQGFIFWRGPSPVDGAALVAIATLETDNPKTGPVVQTWILRADVPPLDAVRSGADASICGSCFHRGEPGVRKRSCYVTVFKAPQSVWNTYARGGYFDLQDDLRTVQELVRGRVVRLGSYGEPAMLPASVWHSLLFTAAGHLGYSHAWREPYADAFRPLVMASVDSLEEQAEAVAAGWRTFRCRTEEQPLTKHEFACLASDEGGKRMQCIDCLACDGASRPGKASVAIIVNGAGAGNFISAPQVREEARTESA